MLRFWLAALVLLPMLLGSACRPPSSPSAPAASAVRSFRLCFIHADTLAEFDAHIDASSADTLVRIGAVVHRLSELRGQDTLSLAGRGEALPHSLVLKEHQYQRYSYRRQLTPTRLRQSSGSAPSLQRVGSYRGVALFAESSLEGAAVYLLVQPVCWFQPYSRIHIISLRSPA